MGTPDPWLSEYFGNNTAAQEETVDDTIEKMASLHLLEKRAAEQGIDLSQYTTEEILEAAELMSQGQEKVASNEDAELEQFFELYKFAGKVTAHAMVAELRDMAEQEKTAGPRLDAVKAAPGKAWEAIRSVPGKVKETEASLSERLGRKLMKDETAQAIASAPKKKIDAETYRSWPLETKKEYMRNAAEEGAEDVVAEAKKRGRIAAGIAGGTAALGLGAGGTALAMRGREKKASATEQLIAERQYEMLKAAGYVDAYGNILAPQQEKTAYDEALEAIDQVALQGLLEAGYR